MKIRNSSWKHMVKAWVGKIFQQFKNLDWSIQFFTVVILGHACGLMTGKIARVK